MLKNMGTLLDGKLIGNRIREARKSAGYTQAELGDYLKLSQAAINKIETGASSLTLENLFNLSNVLGYPVVHFLGISTGDLTQDETEALALFRAIPCGLPKKTALKFLRNWARDTRGFNQKLR